MMTPAKVVFYFLVGLALGAFFVTVADRIYEGGWRGGPTIVALSLPVTIVYFLSLWGVAVWRSWPITGGGLMAAGFLCGIFPFFLGFSQSIICALCLRCQLLFFNSLCYSER
jgi:hypothetical protein